MGKRDHQVVEQYCTLVLGASLKPERYSFKAIERLVNAGIPVRAIGLKEGMVSGISIEVKPILFENIHTITLYLNPNRQEEYIDYILKLKPKRIIFNPGTENPYFFNILKAHNIAIEIACTLVLLSTNQYQANKGQ